MVRPSCVSGAQVTTPVLAAKVQLVGDKNPPCSNGRPPAIGPPRKSSPNPPPMKSCPPPSPLGPRDPVRSPGMNGEPGPLFELEKLLAADSKPSGVDRNAASSRVELDELVILSAHAAVSMAAPPRMKKRTLRVIVVSPEIVKECRGTGPA